MLAGTVGISPRRELLHQVFGKLAEQRRDRVSGRVDARVQRRDLRLQPVELARRERDIELVGDAALVALAHDVERLLQHANGGVQHGRTHLQAAQIDVRPGDVGDDGDQHAVAGRRRRLGIVARGFDLAAVFAEDIEFPYRIESGNELTGGPPMRYVAEPSSWEARPRDRLLPVPRPPPAVASASGNTVP